MEEENDKYVGRVIDNRYRIVKRIGSGGMAFVFKAEDTELNKTVAIKMLKKEKQNDPSYMKSFINEARAVAMLNHENIVHIYDVSVKDDVQYIVMEYIEGITLQTYLDKKGGQLEWREVLGITVQILRALEHAHSKGIIHRDIKPRNIMLLKNGLIKVADFGIAKIPGMDTLTATNKAIGTVYYISPEQARGEATDARSDLYSVGIMMYELACGRLPFMAKDPVPIALMQINDTAESPRSLNSDIPEGMEQIIMRVMEKEPMRRYQSAKGMLKHINAVLENPNIKFRPPVIPDVMDEKDKLNVHSDAGKEVKTRTVVEGKSIMPVILGVVSAFLIVVVILVFLAFDKLADAMNSTTSKELVVSNYIGQVYTDILRQQMEDEGYDVTVKEASADDGTPYNQIISQVPEDGKVAKYIPGEKPVYITLYVYKGSNTIKLPDLTLRDHVSLRSEYINVYEFEIIKEFHKTIPAGYVIKTEPAAGSDVTIGSKIKLYVSDGANVTTVNMVSLSGMDSAVAHDWLKSNGLVLGYIKFEENAMTKGQVISQSIAAGTPVPHGTSVDLVISLGGIETLPPSDTEDDPGEETSESTGTDTEESGIPSPEPFDWLS